MVFNESYKDYLAQAKQLDPNYYQKSEQRLADIEKTLRKTQGKNN